MSPKVRHLLENLPAITTCIGLDRIDRYYHQGCCSVARVSAGSGSFRFNCLSSWCCRVPFRLYVEVFGVSLEEGLCSEGQLTVGAQEELRCRSCITLYNLEEKGKK